jgi:hypothetical protein
LMETNIVLGRKKLPFYLYVYFEGFPPAEEP